MRQPKAATIIRDRRSAIVRALADATAGDIVLIAGKGHEDYQIVGAERLPFSDHAPSCAECLFSDRQDEAA
jgi:UDP-N-acetylmuramoyl-L-alanyl-D-glutamate--2,6-diaminopimelate ligase